MADYQKMYHIMFNAATDAERLAAKAEGLASEAAYILRRAQSECEGLFIEAPEPPITLHVSQKTKPPRYNFTADFAYSKSITTGTIFS